MTPQPTVAEASQPTGRTSNELRAVFPSYARLLDLLLACNGAGQIRKSFVSGRGCIVGRLLTGKKWTSNVALRLFFEAPSCAIHYHPSDCLGDSWPHWPQCRWSTCISRRPMDGSWCSGATPNRRRIRSCCWRNWDGYCRRNPRHELRPRANWRKTDLGADLLRPNWIYQPLAHCHPLQLRKSGQPPFRTDTFVERNVHVLATSQRFERGVAD
jgi:hypothetical protein